MALLSLHLADRCVEFDSGGSWIGFTDRIIEDTFLWEDGTVYDSSTSYSSWLGGTSSTRDCVMVYINNAGLDWWYSHDCDLRLHFFGAIAIKQFMNIQNILVLIHPEEDDSLRYGVGDGDDAMKYIYCVPDETCQIFQANTDPHDE